MNDRMRFNIRMILYSIIERDGEVERKNRIIRGNTSQSTKKANTSNHQSRTVMGEPLGYSQASDNVSWATVGEQD